MNIKTNKMSMIGGVLVLVMGLLYACSADSGESTSPLGNGESAVTLRVGDITYNRIVQGTAGTATPTSATITNFSTLTFSLKSISKHTGTQTPPTIAEDGTVTTTATTSAGSYRVTITPDGNTFTGNSVTVDFYVTIKANDIDDLDTKLKQAITDYGLTGDFNYIDTSAVTDMNFLFLPGFSPSDRTEDSSRTYVTDFNGDISKWDVSSVTDFTRMFSGATKFNQDISGWTVSAGERFSRMFSEAVAFNQDISKWDVSSGVNFFGMFHGAAAFDQDLSEWTVESTATITDMFKDSGMTTLPSWYTP